MSKRVQKLMDQTVFELALRRMKPRGTKMYDAARMIMVDGKSVTEACRINKVARQTAYEGIKNIEASFEELGICPHCGQRLPNV